MYKKVQKREFKIVCVLICVVLLIIFGLVSIINNKKTLIKIRHTSPTATILYSTQNHTNEDVTVKLINPSAEITITNNNGKNTYTFTENGEFTFEFIDKAGNKGSSKAIVDWIDKTAPTADISYDKTELTNQDVVVSLTNVSEEITILNNEGKDTYTFTKNGEFTFEYIDKAGNKGSSKANVNWIDKEPPIAFIKFENNVNYITATLIGVTEPITILNNEGKDTYTFTENGTFTFTYQDSAGNINNTTAKIDSLVNNNQEINSNQTVENNSIDNPINNTDSEETKMPTPKTEKEEDKNLKEEKIKTTKHKKFNYVIIIDVVLLIIAIVLIFKLKKKSQL